MRCRHILLGLILFVPLRPSTPARSARARAVSALSRASPAEQGKGRAGEKQGFGLWNRREKTRWGAPKGERRAVRRGWDKRELVEES